MKPKDVEDHQVAVDHLEEFVDWDNVDLPWVEINSIE